MEHYDLFFTVLQWTVQIEENESSLKENENEAERFSISEQLLSRSMDLFFVLLMRHDPKSAF